MNVLNAALLINSLGFLVGVALYSLLAFMVIRHYRASKASGVNTLLLMTAALGVIWNLGELFLTIQKDLGLLPTAPFITALTYAALGFLPSVVVHSAQTGLRHRSPVIFLAYGFSILASALHFYAAFVGGPVPSVIAMQMLTVGAVGLAILLLILNFRERLEKKAIWATALLVFAVSSLHLSVERSETSWAVELVSHQSSLPLALTILYQSFRFAFADLFLKRAISLLLLAFVAFGMYVWVAAPLLRYHETHDRNDVLAITIILFLWVATALIYPAIHAAAVWFVDHVVLNRADYEKLQGMIASRTDDAEYPEEILDAAGDELAKALAAATASWTKWRTERGGDRAEIVEQAAANAYIRIPTADPPAFEIALIGLGGGRRLLSGETSMLENISREIGRRIDRVRVMRERYEREFKEQEYARLATEARLTALRSQINPHFLFNALTTIGYLIESAPEKAVATLLVLTKLLRGVLNSTGEFSTLGDELRLIESYLDIEKARFEERLSVVIDVPPNLRNLQIPSLILQPLVENAIKHGISQNKEAGEVRIVARLGDEGEGDEVLSLDVVDSGPAKRSDAALNERGFGLSSIEKRLTAYYNRAASLQMSIDDRGWTVAGLRIPAARRVSV